MRKIESKRGKQSSKPAPSSPSLNAIAIADEPRPAIRALRLGNPHTSYLPGMEGLDLTEQEYGGPILTVNVDVKRKRLVPLQRLRGGSAISSRSLLRRDLASTRPQVFQLKQQVL